MTIGVVLLQGKVNRAKEGVLNPRQLWVQEVEAGKGTKVKIHREGALDPKQMWARALEAEVEEETKVNKVNQKGKSRMWLVGFTSCQEQRRIPGHRRV